MRFFFIFANLNGQMLNGSLIMLLLSISHINYWAFLLVFMNVSLDLMDPLLLDVRAYRFTKEDCFNICCSYYICKNDIENAIWLSK